MNHLHIVNKNLKKSEIVAKKKKKMNFSNFCIANFRLQDSFITNGNFTFSVILSTFTYTKALFNYGLNLNPRLLKNNIYSFNAFTIVIVYSFIQSIKNVI